MENYNVSPNEMLGFMIRMNFKNSLLENLKQYNNAEKKSILNMQKNVIEEILYEIEREDI